MKKLFTALLVLTTFQGFSQVSVGMSYVNYGFGMSLSALSQEGGIEGTIGFSKSLTQVMSPSLVYVTVGKQLLITHYDDDNYSITPSIGFADVTKKVEALKDKASDLVSVTGFKPFYGLELGKDAYMGRISLVTNYSGALFYGVKMRVFFRTIM